MEDPFYFGQFSEINIFAVENGFELKLSFCEPLLMSYCENSGTFNQIDDDFFEGDLNRKLQLCHKKVFLCNLITLTAAFRL